MEKPEDRVLTTLGLGACPKEWRIYVSIPTSIIGLGGLVAN